MAVEICYPFSDRDIDYEFDARDCAIASIKECEGYSYSSLIDSLIGYLCTDTLVAFVVEELDCDGLSVIEREKMAEYYDLHCH